MKVNTLYLSTLSGKLTCSQVMQLLMDQPTKPNARGIESHAHMHTTEGFKVQAVGFGGDAYALDRKQTHYGSPTHLYPEGSTIGGVSPDYGRMVGSGITGSTYTGVYQDADRLPPTGEYAHRTGLPELPKLTGPVKYVVFRKVLKSKPIAEIKNSMIEVNLLTEAEYLFKNGKIVFREEAPEVLAPYVKASPAHTMFPDAESTVMHLTAALLCNAGRTVIHHLTTLPAGGPTTVGIFSKSAVRAVTAADVRVPNQMIERRLEVDTGQPRDRATGFFPSTGKVLTDQSGIDHVVVILGKRLTGDLNVLTCYPSKVTTHASIGTATKDNEDIAELRLGSHTIVRQDTLIKLTW